MFLGGSAAAVKGARSGPSGKFSNGEHDADIHVLRGGSCQQVQERVAIAVCLMHIGTPRQQQPY